MWHWVFSVVAVAGGYAWGCRHECTHFARCLVHIQLRAAEQAILNSGTAMWGRPEIEGGMLGQKYGIKLHLIEKHNAGISDVIGHQLICSSGSKLVEENASCYSDPPLIHSWNEVLCHFVPILCKTLAINKPIYSYIIYIS
jgi:hypothetical protein